MPFITALITSKRNASKQVIHVDGKATATLSQKQIHSLCLEVGTAWEPGLAQIVADSSVMDEGFEYAMRLLNRKPYSRTQIGEKLLKHGCDASMIERVVGKLLAIGAINDQAIAQQLTEEIDRRRPAGPLLKRAKLAQRGIDETTIEKVLASSTDRKSQIAAARKLAESRSKSMAKLSELDRKRKLWTLLARRGFDEEVIDAVVGDVHVED